MKIKESSDIVKAYMVDRGIIPSDYKGLFVVADDDDYEKGTGLAEGSELHELEDLSYRQRDTTVIVSQLFYINAIKYVLTERLSDVDETRIPIFNFIATVFDPDNNIDKKVVEEVLEERAAERRREEKAATDYKEKRDWANFHKNMASDSSANQELLDELRKNLSKALDEIKRRNNISDSMVVGPIDIFADINDGMDEEDTDCDMPVCPFSYESNTEKAVDYLMMPQEVFDFMYEKIKKEFSLMLHVKDIRSFDGDYQLL